MSSTVAILTPPGTAALATLGLTGPAAWPAVRALFAPRTGELPEAPEAGRFWLGRMGGDDVVLSVRQTGPVMVLECHGHGGREAVRWLVEQLAGHGLVEVGWDEHLRLTAPDPLAALAASVLARCPTARTAAIALDQLNGATRAALGRILAQPDPGLIDELLRWAPLGAHLAEPWRVVLAGPPNVGKSSLLNALAGHQRSVVAPTPGTTRDIVTATLALDGWPVEVADTAGLHEAGGAIEQAGVALARQAAEAADLRVWVADASGQWAPPPDDGVATLVAANKVDLTPTWDISKVAAAARVSAWTGEGVAELGAAISRALVPEAPPAGAAVPLGGELAAALRRARAAGPPGAARHLAGWLG